MHLAEHGRPAQKADASRARPSRRRRRPRRRFASSSALRTHRARTATRRARTPEPRVLQLDEELAAREDLVRGSMRRHRGRSTDASFSQPNCLAVSSTRARRRRRFGRPPRRRWLSGALGGSAADDAARSQRPALERRARSVLPVERREEGQSREPGEPSGCSGPRRRRAQQD